MGLITLGYASWLALLRHDPFGVVVPMVPPLTWGSLLALSFAMLIDTVTWANGVFDRELDK